MDQRALEDPAVLREDHLPGLRIEICEVVVLLARRRGEFVTQSQIQRQFGRDFVIVLDEVELHILPLVHNGEAGQRQLRGQPQQ